MDDRLKDLREWARPRPVRPLGPSANRLLRGLGRRGEVMVQGHAPSGPSPASGRRAGPYPWHAPSALRSVRSGACGDGCSAEPRAALPASQASRHRLAQRHHRSPALRPGNQYAGCAERSFPRCRKPQKLISHDRTDRMPSAIVPIGPTTAVPEPSGHRVKGTDCSGCPRTFSAGGRLRATTPWV